MVFKFKTLGTHFGNKTNFTTLKIIISKYITELNNKVFCILIFIIHLMYHLGKIEYL